MIRKISVGIKRFIKGYVVLSTYYKAFFKKYFSNSFLHFLYFKRFESVGVDNF